jgi:hypothetical protein
LSIWVTQPLRRRLGARPARGVGAALLAALWGSGCYTAAPLQTASTVSPGAYRLGGQLSGTFWCGAYPPEHCAVIPAALPLPELRLSARHGLSERIDMGLSARGLLQLDGSIRGAQAGLAADGKGELWSVPGRSGGRHLLSTGAGLGFTSTFLRGQARRIGELQAVIPLLYGHQRAEGAELFAGPRLVQRWSFADVNADGRRELLTDTWGALTVGYAGAVRGGPRLVYGLEYFTPFSSPIGGLLTFSVGGLWDLGG